VTEAPEQAVTAAPEPQAVTAAPEPQSPTDAPALTTGWEPDVPVGDTILRRFVYSYADRVALTARAAGGRAERGAAAAYADARSAFVFDNAVVLLRPPTGEGIDAVLDRAARVFPDERVWVLLSVWPTPDLTPRGLTLVGHPPLMIRPPDTRHLRNTHHSENTRQPEAAQGDAASGPVIRRVTDADALADFTRVLVEGYPMPADGHSSVFTPELIADDAIHLYVGYADSQPVVTAGAAVGHGIVEVDWVATLPAYRRRGFGAALTAAALAARSDLPAMLIASDDGAPVYRRLGFLPLLRCTLWMRETDTDSREAHADSREAHADGREPEGS
jgi:ribosomal protein S18 acetylase RimI-like enzyme